MCDSLRPLRQRTALASGQLGAVNGSQPPAPASLAEAARRARRANAAGRQSALVRRRSSSKQRRRACRPGSARQAPRREPDAARWGDTTWTGAEDAKRARAGPARRAAAASRSHAGLTRCRSCASAADATQCQRPPPARRSRRVAHGRALLGATSCAVVLIGQLVDQVEHGAVLCRRDTSGAAGAHADSPASGSSVEAADALLILVEDVGEDRRVLEHREVAARQLDRFETKQAARDPSRAFVVEQLVLARVQKRRGHVWRALERIRRAEHCLRLRTQARGHTRRGRAVQAPVQLADGPVVWPPAATVRVHRRAFVAGALISRLVGRGRNPPIAGHR